MDRNRRWHKPPFKSFFAYALIGMEIPVRPLENSKISELKQKVNICEGITDKVLQRLDMLWGIVKKTWFLKQKEIILNKNSCKKLLQEKD